MKAKGWLLTLASTAVIALAVALILSGLDGDPADPGNDLAAGQIYAIAAGDPLDVVYEADDAGTGCLVLGRLAEGGGIPYGGRTRCFHKEEVDTDGALLVVLPASAEDPALVVGVVPAGATSATASGIGWKTTQAEVKGRSFLASLEPAPPDVTNLEPIRVKFEY